MIRNPNWYMNIDFSSMLDIEEYVLSLKAPISMWGFKHLDNPCPGTTIKRGALYSEIVQEMFR